MALEMMVRACVSALRPKDGDWTGEQSSGGEHPQANGGSRNRLGVCMDQLASLRAWSGTPEGKGHDEVGREGESKILHAGPW